MSLRINSDFNGVTDPDAGRYIAAVEQADGNQLLEFGVGKAINDFVVGCKQDRIWDAIKASCILAGARTLSGALVPLAGTAPTNFNFVSGDYNRKTGLLGDASIKSINTGYAQNANNSRNNQHVSIYVSEADIGASGVRTYIGAADGVFSYTSIARVVGSRLGAASNNDDLKNINSNTSAINFMGVARNNSNGYSGRSSGTTTTFSSSATSNVPSANTYYLYAENTGTLSRRSNGRLAFYSIGESLDLALLDARVTALITAFGVAIP
jgi:hypothetical protein